MKKILCATLCLVTLLCMPQALAYDAEAARTWLVSFAEALADLEPLNDPMETADPAHAGEYLFEHTFGMVLSSVPQSPEAENIIEIDISTAQVTDCRGVRVGMPLSAALDGAQINATQASLAVLTTQDAGLGWSWAYVSESGVYGVEYITYGGEGVDMHEYTLTYMIDENRTISGIHMRVSQATQAQAEDGMRIAEEIASRQMGEALAIKNEQEIMNEDDLSVMGFIKLNSPVADFVSVLGEPIEVQVLPGSSGRLLIYEGAVLTLGFDEYTGEELVTGVSVNGTGMIGPRGLCVEMSVQEATSLFRCDADVNAMGGMLYSIDDPEAGGTAYGEMLAKENGTLLVRYACLTASGNRSTLEIGVENGMVNYWQMYQGTQDVQDVI